MAASALSRARRGARYLDGKLGKGWRRRIRRRRLDMGAPVYLGETGCGCVLAQIDAALRTPKGKLELVRCGLDEGGGWYSSGAGRVGLDPYSERAEALGFLAREDEDYGPLNAAWRKVLAEG